MAAATTAVQAQAGRRSPRPHPAIAGTVALAAVYYLLAALAVTLWLWRDPASRTVAGNPNDADQIAWFFRYDATAVVHLRLPALVTTAMNAPQGVNAMWNTFMMLPGVLLAPVTLLFGPQSALTVFLTAGFAGSATAMFAVLRRWDVSGPAAALGGAVYGFSPAVLHSAIGHYDLQFAVLPPLIVHVGLRLATGRTSAVRGGLWLGLLVTAQVFITEETLLGTAMAGVIIVAVLAVSRPRAVADKIATVAAGLGVAACVTAVIAGYPLWVQFFGPLQQHGSPFTPDFFKNDLSSFVVPSSYLLFHTSGSAAAALRYQGHLPEYLGYLGWPLIIVLLLAAIAGWRRLPVRAAAVAFAVLSVFSLGGTLLFGGHEHHAIKLPWYWLEGLPLLNAALPDRFSIVADGAGAALLAFAVDAARPAFAAFAARRLPRLAVGWRPAAVVMCRRGPGRLAHRAEAAARRRRDSAAARLVGGVRRAAAAGVGQRPGGADPDVHLHRTAALAGRHGRTRLAGRRVFHGPGLERAQLHRRERHAGRGPVPERHLDLFARRACRRPWRAGSRPTPTRGRAGYVPVKAVTDTKMREQIKAWRVSAVVAVAKPDSRLGRYLTVLLGPPAVVAGDVLAWRTSAK